MEKLFWTISLSLLIGCAEKAPLEGEFPSPIMREGTESGAPWPEVRLENIKMMENEDIRTAEKRESYFQEEKRFYSIFKDQFKNNSYSYAVKDQSGLLIEVMAPKKATLYFSIANIEKVRDIKISVSKLDGPDRKLHFSLDPTVTPLQLRADLSALGQKPFMAVVKIEDFSFNLGQNIYQFKSAKKAIENSQYRLHIDDGWKKETFYVNAGKSLEEAFLQYGVEYQVDRKLELVSLDEKMGIDWNQNLNILADESQFWRIVNTPDQKITFRPIAGQDILIKRIQLKKLKNYAAIKKVRTLKLSAPIIPAVSHPKVIGRKIKSVTAYLLIPKQKEKYEIDWCGSSLNFGGNSSMKGGASGNIINYTVGYEKLKYKTPSYMFSEVGMKSFELQMRRPPVELLLGRKYTGSNKKCLRKYKNAIKQKNYPHKYQLSVEVEETMAL